MKAAKRMAVTAFFFACILAVCTAGPDPISLYRQGLEAMTFENYYPAIEKYKQALALNSAYLDPMIGLVRCYYALGELEEALGWVEKGKKYDKNNIQLANLEGSIQVGLHNFEAAGKLFNAVLAKEPNNLDAGFGLAELDIAEGKEGQAVSRYLSSLKVAPNNKEALIRLIDLYSGLGEFGTAGRYLELALKNHADDAKIHYLAGKYSVQITDYGSAETHLAVALALKPDYFKAMQLQGIVQVYRGKYGEAMTTLTPALQIDDGFEKVLTRFTLGMAAGQLEKTADAAAHYQAALKIRYDDEISRLALENLALASINDKDKIRQDLAAWHFLNAENFMKQNYTSKALIAYRRCLQLYPDHRTARIKYAGIAKTGGYPVKYYYSLKVLKDYYGYKDNSIIDELDIYESFLYNGVTARWNNSLKALYPAETADPVFNEFTVEKTKYKIAFFTIPADNRFIHPLADKVLTDYFRELFTRYETIGITGGNTLTASAGDAFKSARDSQCDFYLVLTYEELERSLAVNCDLCLGRTGTRLTTLKAFRTGNNKVDTALYSLSTQVFDLLPVKGKLLIRNFNNGLINLGRLDKIKTGDKLDIIRKDKIRLDHREIKYLYESGDLLGSFEVTTVDENLSEGKITKAGFFDYINPWDEVLLLPGY